MAISIEEIVSGLKISRSEFGRIFLQAQMNTVQNPNDRVLFDAVVHSGIDQTAFKEALEWAQRTGYLEDLVRAIVAEGLEDGSITAALAREALASGGSSEQKAALQAITNLAQGFQRPEVLYRGVNVGMRWTVRILIDGNFSGSGILIGPHLVLTAWHVVRALFDPAGPNRFQPKTGANNRITVEFDDLSGVFDDRASSVNPVRIPAHSQWCATFSECRPEELAGGLPQDLSQLEGFWDYAIIRLAKAPGLERRWASLDARAVVPVAKAKIIVFQYPAGQPMRLDDNEVVAPDASAASAIPRCRFLHRANTLGGSSGAPCFDRTFMLFGLHQGEWVKVPRNTTVINRGVPIVRIKEHIQLSIRELPVPDPSETPVWKLSSTDLFAPVVGCDPFQSLVWKSAVAGTPRLIVTTGEPGTGKTFRILVLSAMLPDSGHLKVALRADALSKLEATHLATLICRTAGAVIPTFVSAAEYSSTVSTWIRDEVMRKTMDALEKVRSGRLVWITLADLNHTEIQGENASAFLQALYEQTRVVDWVRILLDGMKGDLPGPILSIVERHRAGYITREEIETYVRRAIAEFETPLDEAVSGLSKAAYKSYDNLLNSNPSNAARQLSDLLEDLVGGYLEK